MRFLSTFGAALMSLLISIPVEAETADTLSLVSKSPFLPPGFQAPGTPGKPATPAATSNQFEFRGVYQLRGTYYFNLYDVRERKASWLTEENSNEMNVRIISFDRESNELSLDASGKAISLSLMETSNRVLPVQTAPAPATATDNRATKPATTNPVRRRVIRPTSRTRSPSSSTSTRRQVIRPSR